MRKRKNRKVDILGTKYDVKFIKEKEDEYQSLGTFDGSVKLINILKLKDGHRTLRNLDNCIDTTIKHEIIHAFMYESGLDNQNEWAHNEELVDWIAIQFDKMKKAFDSVIK